MSDEKFELSRRNALIGLGTVGAASAGAGLGTSAYFNDQEGFDGNTIQAGEFGLTVEQQVHSVDQDGIGPDEEEFDAGVGDNGVWVQDTITIEDAKPGDSYEFCWDISVEDNPGYVAVAACYSDQNGVEADNVTLDDLWDIDEESDLSTVGAETLVDSLTLENGGSVSYDYDTVAELLSDLESGTLLDDGNGGVTFEPGDTWTMCVELSIPGEVGNELQGALLEWDLGFYAEQARHNDGSGVAGRAAEALVCETGECEPECAECTAPDPGSDDFDVTVEGIDESSFPTVEVTTRVETEAGGDGDLGVGDFDLCEETVGGLGDGYCGQTIDDVRFGGEDEGAEADVVICIDTSGSMDNPQSKIDNAKDGAKTLVDTLGPGVNIGLVEFDSSGRVVEYDGDDMELGTQSPDTIKDAIDSLTAGGQTDIGDGISVSQNEFDERGRSGVPHYMVLLGNGDTSGGESDANTAKDAGTIIYGIAYGDGADSSDFEDIVGEEQNDPDWEDYAFDADQDDITQIFEDIGEIISGTYTIVYEAGNCEADGNDRDVLVYVDDPDEGDADAEGSYVAPSS